VPIELLHDARMFSALTEKPRDEGSPRNGRSSDKRACAGQRKEQCQGYDISYSQRKPRIRRSGILHLEGYLRSV